MARLIRHVRSLFAWKVVGCEVLMAGNRRCLVKWTRENQVTGARESWREELGE